MTSCSETGGRLRVRFERNASRVVFDPGSHSFVVTWSKCNRPAGERLASSRDALRWIPSISAVTTLYDRGCVPSCQTVYAATAVGRAWDAGDRACLDTEGARKAAELVRDIATVCGDPSAQSASCDAGQAMRHLLDEMAAVRFAGADLSDEAVASVLESLGKATDECLAVPGFREWAPRDMRRRFLFGMKRRECTDVVYTLASLLFSTGSCPLLSLSDSRALRLNGIAESGLDGRFDRDAVMAFFRFALEKMRGMKADGRSSLGVHLTQQQLTDTISQKNN